MEGKSFVEVKISDLRFTQSDIAPKFKHFPDLKVLDAVTQISKGLLDPNEKFKMVTVHQDNEGVLWCENNRTLYVLRRAGVTKFKANMITNDYKSRRDGEEEKRKRKDPNFLPRIRGESEESGSFVYERVDSRPSEVRFEEEGKSVVGFEEERGSVGTGLLAVAAGALFAGYASWKLYRSAQSDHKK